MCCVCFFCLGCLFVWRQLCWVFNILCRFLKGWESKTARNSVLLHAECGPSQCSKLIICTERICYLKKAFQKIHKRFRNPQENPIFYSRDCCSRVLPKKKKEKKNVINGLLVVSQSPFANHNGFGVQAFDFAKEYFMAFKQPEAGVVTPRCSCAFPLGEIGREASPTGKRTQLPISQWFLKLNGAFDSHFFPPRLSKTTISKYHRKKYQQQLIQQTSANLRIRTNQQNPYHLKP